MSCFLPVTGFMAHDGIKTNMVTNRKKQLVILINLIFNFIYFQTQISLKKQFGKI
jgi:hypothetical protein